MLTAAVFSSPFAAAAVSHGATAASHSARVGSSRNALVSLSATGSRQGTRALVQAPKAPASLWPHWGYPPKAPLAVAPKAPASLWPHWGGGPKI